MKRIIVAACATLLCTASAAFAVVPADGVLGVWLTQSKDGKFQVARCGESVCGKLIWGKTANDPDKKNKNPDLRSRALNSFNMLQGYRLSKDGARWVDGEIYNPEDGNFYRSTLEPGPGDTLKLKGCLGPFCQTQTWTRVAP
jgi:uncharacterized protein (DUF2147 family)